MLARSVTITKSNYMSQFNFRVHLLSSCVPVMPKDCVNVELAMDIKQLSNSTTKSSRVTILGSLIEVLTVAKPPWNNILMGGKC